MSRRAVAAAAVIGTLLVLGLAAYAGWSGLQARSELLAARNSAERLRDALESGDQSAAEAALSDLQSQSSAARDHTGDVVWSLLSHLPFIGDDARAVRAVAGALDSVAGDGLPGLVASASRLDGSAFAPRNGRIDLAAVENLRSQVARAASAFAAAQQSMDGIDTDGLLGAVRGPVLTFDQQLDRASRALGSANRAVRVLPDMLGADRPHQWLLVFQNNAEIRATGGLPASQMLVRTDHGSISSVVTRSSSDFPVLDQPVLPLTDFEKLAYGPHIGEWVVDANYTPDFGRASQIWAARWAPEHLDGVIAIDPVALSYLLAATGPIDVPGGQLTADNAVQTLLHDVYVQVPVSQQDAYFAGVAGRVFEALTGGVGSPRAIVEALARAASERRLLVHPFDPAEQSAVSGTPVAGESLDAGDGSPRIDIAINDATGAKMSYYLRYDTSVTGSCDNGTQHYRGTMQLASETPADIGSMPDYVTGGGDLGVPVGSQLVLVDLFAPQGGSIGPVAADKAALDHQTFDANGRPMATIPLMLTPGQRLTLTWEMAGAAGQGGSTPVVVTPGVVAQNESLALQGACG